MRYELSRQCGQVVRHGAPRLLAAGLPAIGTAPPARPPMLSVQCCPHLRLRDLGYALPGWVGQWLCVRARCALTSSMPCACPRAGAEDQAAACCVPRGAPHFNSWQRTGIRPPDQFRVHPVIRSVGLWWGYCSEAWSGLLEEGRIGRVSFVCHTCIIVVSRPERRRDEWKERALLEAVGEGCGLYPWRNGSTVWTQRARVASLVSCRLLAWSRASLTPIDIEGHRQALLFEVASFVRAHLHDSVGDTPLQPLL